MWAGGRQVGVTLVRVTQPKRGFAGKHPLLRFASRCFQERCLMASLPG